MSQAFIFSQSFKSRRVLTLILNLTGRRAMSTEAVPTDIAALEADITSQTIKFNQLRLAGQPHDDVKQTLAHLKRNLALVKNAGKPRDKEKKREEKDTLQETKKKEPLLLKTAKVRH